MNKRDILLGIDVGTYSTKGVLTDANGTVLESYTVEHTVELPHPGWAQQDADAVWWGDLVLVARELSTRARNLDARISAVGVSAIGPCLLPLDEHGRPLRPGILYGIDTRAHEEIVALNTELGEQAVRDFSRMELSSQAVGPKLHWLRNHEPEIWAATRTFTTATSYLVYRLTGRHVIDHHTAAHWMPYYDPAGQMWSEELHAEPRLIERLPALGWANELAGTISTDGAAATGLPAGIPVAVGTVDALAEGVGVGVRDPGDIMVMYGTTAFFILRTPQPVMQPGMWSLPGAFPEEQTLAAGMATSGAVTRWFRDQFASDLRDQDAYGVLFEQASSVPAGARGLLALPYFSGERTPINDPDARGVIAGLTLTHSRADIYRALLECVAYGIRHNLEAMTSSAQRLERVVAVGGGTKTSTWLQIVSDVTGLVQDVPEVTIGASYGDAYLAGIAAGVVDADVRWERVGERIRPDEEHRQVYDRGFRRYRALYEATRDLVHELARDGETR